MHPPYKILIHKQPNLFTNDIFHYIFDINPTFPSSIKTHPAPTKSPETIHVIKRRITDKHPQQTDNNSLTLPNQRHPWTSLKRLCIEVNTSLIPKYIEYATGKHCVLPCIILKKVYSKFRVNLCQNCQNVFLFLGVRL